MQTKTKTIKIAHSPDSDDAFMFYAIKEKKIELHDFDFEFSSDEIGKLNEIAVNSYKNDQSPDIDVIAASFHTYFLVKEQFEFLRSGCSLANKDYGPRLVVKSGLKTQELKKIAIPGQYTTAFLALEKYLSSLGSLTVEPEFILCSYNEVFDLLENNAVDASLLIHESQLKYKELGYELIVDLGSWWHEYSNGLRLALGTNIIHKSHGRETIKLLDQILKESILWSKNNFGEVMEYSREFANNELDDFNAKKYLDMYVDESTVELSDQDLKSIELMQKKLFDSQLLKIA